MKTFAKLYSSFWTNSANWELLKLGATAQSVALYLIGNAHHNMLWAYYLPLAYIVNDIKLPQEQVQQALQELCTVNYCRYDAEYQYVWVCNMAFEQNAEELDIRDNRVKALQALWESLPDGLMFLGEIHQKYHTAFHLEVRPFPQKKSTAPSKSEKILPLTPPLRGDAIPFEGASKGIPTPFEGNSDPLQSPLSPPSKPINTEKSGKETNFAENGEITFEGDAETLQSPFEGGAEGLPSPANCSENKQNCKNFYPSKGGARGFEGGTDTLQSKKEVRSKNLEERSKKKEGEENLNHCRASATGGGEIPPGENFSPEEKNLPQVAEENLPQLAEEDFLHDEENEPLPITEKSSLPAAAENLPQATAESLQLLPAKPPNANPPAKTPPKRHVAHRSASDEHITQVFAHWKGTMRHEKSNLDAKRRALIRQALQLGYSVEQLCQAITGCSHTPHNMGQNDRGQRYDGLHIILRDADQIDRFIHNYLHPPQPFTKAHQLTQTNMHVMREWLQHKLQEPDEKAGGAPC